MRRRRRKGLRVLLDHLLDVLLEPHEHLLPDVDIEVHLDRLAGGFDGDAACERHCRRNAKCSADQRSFHFLPPDGGDGLGAGACVGAALPCCSLFVVLSTSTFSAGESIGNGTTGAMTWVGSLKALAIWMSARNGPLILRLSFSGSLLKAECTRLAMIPWPGPSDTVSIARRVANFPARSPSRRMTIER